MRAWYEKAKKYAATKDFSEYWVDFTNAWPVVRLPAGASMLTEALERAEQANPPEWAADYGPKAKLLASLCRELQRSSGSNPFFLSNRKAAELIGEGHQTCGRWLRSFVGDGALQEVTKGDNETKRASRYLYVADDLHTSRPIESAPLANNIA